MVRVLYFMEDIKPTIINDEEEFAMLLILGASISLHGFVFGLSCLHDAAIGPGVLHGGERRELSERTAPFFSYHLRLCPNLLTFETGVTRNFAPNLFENLAN